MKKALLTTALIAALGTSASAQGITPVATTPETDVTVGTLGMETGILLGILGTAAVLVAVTSSSDGTN